ncbi:ribosomal protein S18-alanine N-acetyltransferase [soil metagenome]
MREDPATDPVLRKLSLPDLSRVVEIETVSFSTPWRRETFESLLGRTDTDMIAAVEADMLVGYAICWTVVDQAELGNVAVAMEARGRGLGRMLVVESLERVRKRGARECFLEVRESNTSARKLYEQTGFTVIGRRSGYYRKPIEDAFVMRVELS